MTAPICADSGPDCEGPIDTGNLCRAHRAEYGGTRFGQPPTRDYEPIRFVGEEAEPASKEGE